MKTQTAYIPEGKFGEAINTEWVFFRDGRPVKSGYSDEARVGHHIQYFRPVEVPVSESEPIKSGIELIKDERARQISEEGWTPEHDDAHTDEGMARAAACYAVGQVELMLPPSGEGKHYVWPWGREWWKPTPGDRIRELTKAGALICAEIDRLIRAQNYDPTPYCAVCQSRTTAGCSCQKQPKPEPEPDPYAELKAAFAAGKVIQFKNFRGEWEDGFGWGEDLSLYRVKPEPVKVPLGPEDVPPGSAIRFKGHARWSMVSHLETDGVFLTGGTEFCSFEKLMQEDREISWDFGITWDPCWKEGAQ